MKQTNLNSQFDSTTDLQSTHDKQSDHPPDELPIDAVECWNTTISIDNQQYLVGRYQHFESVYPLFYPVEQQYNNAFAGSLIAVEESYSTERTIAVVPDGTPVNSGSSFNSPTIPEFTTGDNEEPQQQMPATTTVSEYSQLNQLDAVLQEIRSDLTDTDWSVENPRTSYGEWGKAVRKLSDYRSSQPLYEQHLPSDSLRLNETTHSIARYSHNAEALIDSAGRAMNQHLENGYRDTNPFALVELLLDYHQDMIKDDQS